MNISGLVPGIAYSLLLPSDGNFANELIRNLAQSNQKVTPELERLAKTATRKGGYAERGPDRFGKGGIGVDGGAVAMTSAMLARGAPSSQSGTVFKVYMAFLNRTLSI